MKSWKLQINADFLGKAVGERGFEPPTPLRAPSAHNKEEPNQPTSELPVL
jgi:hypothetical protein